MQALCEKEIRELHTFFEAWYQGAIANSDDAFQRLEGVLAPAFTLITSDGYTFTRDQVLALLRDEYGARPDIKMWVDNVRLRYTAGDVILATYEEHGTTADGERATLITALLCQRPERPNGLEWIHIHEVRLPPQS
jgi:hypothetical protein